MNKRERGCVNSVEEDRIITLEGKNAGTKENTKKCISKYKIITRLFSFYIHQNYKYNQLYKKHCYRDMVCVHL